MAHEVAGILPLHLGDLLLGHLASPNDLVVLDPVVRLAGQIPAADRRAQLDLLALEQQMQTDRA